MEEYMYQVRRKRRIEGGRGWYMYHRWKDGET